MAHEGRLSQPEPQHRPLPRDRFAWCGDSLAYWAAHRPDSVAVSDSTGATLTYRALEAAVADWAAALADAGLRQGDRLMILCENSIAAALAVFAAQRMRAWAVPLNARLSAHEVGAIAAHCGPRLILTTDAASPDAAAHGARLGATPRAPFAACGAALAPGAAPGMPEAVSSDPKTQIAALIYTTGTTGEPKGVMLTHDNLMFVAGRSSEMRRLTPADRVYGVLPISHVFGLASVLNGTLYQGARLDLVARFTAEGLARALAEDGTTIFQGVPQMYARMVSLAESRGGLPAPKLRYISCGGAPLDLGLKARVEALWGQPLHNGYGLTETSPTVTTTQIENPVSDGSAGPAVADVELRIAKPGGGPVPPGEVGEIEVRGRLVMKGYYRAPEATAAVMTPDGYLRSGDLGRLDERGHLYVVGRSKELIIRSGFNVYPPEVEGVLTTHPDVALAAVLGRKTADGNEEVVAFLQPRPGRDIDIEALKAHAAAKLAPYKRPSDYRVLAELPAAATGKLLKHKLKEVL
jgi:acyl-CoA synthetase (AMP-forming)/AMP-acid ligase II